MSSRKNPFALNMKFKFHNATISVKWYDLLIPICFLIDMNKNNDVSIGQNIVIFWAGFFIVFVFDNFFDYLIRKSL